MPIYLSDSLKLERCPHCGIANPHLRRTYAEETRNHAGADVRVWSVYVCSSCGSFVTAYSAKMNGEILGHFPKVSSVDLDIPERPRTFLKQASESFHAPSGAVMLCASAVDAMLKSKGYTEGSLYARIEQATREHVITADMAQWAHQVRLDANDQRHADELAHLPTTEEAKRVLDFTATLAQILFVLPGRVQRGLSAKNAVDA